MGITEPASAIGCKTDVQVQIYTHKHIELNSCGTLFPVYRICTYNVLISLSAIDHKMVRPHNKHWLFASILFFTCAAN